MATIIKSKSNITNNFHGAEGHFVGESMYEAQKPFQYFKASQGSHGVVFLPEKGINTPFNNAGTKLRGTPKTSYYIQVGDNRYVMASIFKDVKPDGNFSGAEGASNPSSETPAFVKALPTILSSAGFIWGLGYAFKHKKKFWAYVGYSFLGSVVGATGGGLIKAIAYPSTVSFSGADGKGDSDCASECHRKYKNDRRKFEKCIQKCHVIYQARGGSCWKSGNQTCCNRCTGCDVACFDNPS